MLQSGLGCEPAFVDCLDKYDLRDAVPHGQGSYFAIMAGTITLYIAGGAVLYDTWAPN